MIHLNKCFTCDDDGFYIYLSELCQRTNFNATHTHHTFHEILLRIKTQYLHVIMSMPSYRRVGNEDENDQLVNQRQDNNADTFVTIAISCRISLLKK